MSNGNTIWEAAAIALESLNGSGTLEEIYAEITKRSLYDFGTADPDDAPHVLDTELKRKCSNSNRTDRTGEALFEMELGGVYKLISPATGERKEKKVTGTKRIHRARDKEGIINSLMDEKVGVFKEIWRLLIFAAQIGMQEGSRTPLGSVDSGKGIDQSTFGNCPSWPGLNYLMALVEEDSADSLAGSADAEERRLVIFQEYANAGLTVLQDFFQDRIVDLDGLLSFIDERSKDKAQEVDLDLVI